MLANRSCRINYAGENTRNRNAKNLKDGISPTRPTGICSLNSASKRLLAKFVNQMVASAFQLSGERLLRHDRGNAKAARARQVSVYLMHTCLSLTLTEIARVYGKDRTTIGHGCRVVEDLRDTPAFDDRIIELEQMVQTVLALTGHNKMPGEVK